MKHLVILTRPTWVQPLVARLQPHMPVSINRSSDDWLAHIQDAPESQVNILNIREVDSLPDTGLDPDDQHVFIKVIPQSLGGFKLHVLPADQYVTVHDLDTAAWFIQSQYDLICCHYALLVSYDGQNRLIYAGDFTDLYQAHKTAKDWTHFVGGCEKDGKYMHVPDKGGDTLAAVIVSIQPDALDRLGELKRNYIRGG